MSDDLENAREYDSMIGWEMRLSREIPVIVDFLQPGSLLDVACSSGRHSFALEQYGFEPYGVDISDGMIHIAQELAVEKDSKARFVVADAADPGVIDTLHQTGAPRYFENAILLGNAIANLGSLEKGRQLMRNIFILLKPGGRLFVQTIDRPSKPHYNPLREVDGNILQRIMVPVVDSQHNVELHVNLIGKKPISYVRQVADNKFYMYTRSEFKALLEQTGFYEITVYSGYERQEPRGDNAETLIWEIKKPEIEIFGPSMELFSKYGIDRQHLIANILKISQETMQQEWYHCIRGYRFIYPRITSHPRYDEIIADFDDKKFLDLGCNMGTDLRQLVLDGVDAEQLTGVDLNDRYFKLGYELFEDKDDCNITFISTNILTDEFFVVGEPMSGKFVPDQFDIIHSGSLLHLLKQDEIKQVLQKVYHLLSDGGIFFGRFVGKDTPQYIGQGLKYLHSPKSFKNELLDHGFANIEVLVLGDDIPIGERSQGEILQLGFYATK